MTTLLLALAPALSATRRQVAESLSHRARTHVGGRQLARKSLVTVQIALTIVLLVGAGLLLRSFTRMMRVSPGFNAENVLAFRVSASWGETNDMPRVPQRLDRTVNRVAAIPGVESASISTGLPGVVDTYSQLFQIVGRDPNAPNGTVSSLHKAASANYVRVMQIPLLKGETCPPDADPRATNNMLVNRKFAESFFPGENPIGRQLVYDRLRMALGARPAQILSQVLSQGAAIVANRSHHRTGSLCRSNHVDSKPARRRIDARRSRIRRRAGCAGSSSRNDGLPPGAPCRQSGSDGSVADGIARTVRMHLGASVTSCEETRGGIISMEAQL